MSAIKNFAKKVLPLKLLEKAGLSLIKHEILKYFSHYLWIYKLPGIPKLKITYKEKTKITNADIYLCERLLKAYKLVSQEKILIVNMP